MKLYVLSMIYVAKRDTGVHYQEVGATPEAAIAKLNAALRTWREELFTAEEMENGDGIPCLFELDGMWVSGNDEPELPLEQQDPALARLEDIREQLAAWCNANMDAYSTSLIEHEIE